MKKTLAEGLKMDKKTKEKLKETQREVDEFIDAAFWSRYRELEADPYPPFVFGEETREMLIQSGGDFVSFPNEADRMTYGHFFNNTDKPLIVGSDDAYNRFVADAEYNLRTGAYKDALIDSLGGIKLNPVGMRARLYHAMALWFLNKYEEAEKELIDSFQYVTSGSDMFAYYKQIRFIEELNKQNFLVAAACIEAAAQYYKYYFLDREANDPEVMMRNLTGMQCVDIDVDDAKKRFKEILQQAGIPYISPEELTQRRFEYGIIDSYAADTYEAVIDDRRNPDLITDKDELPLYDNTNVVGMEFANINEARAYASTQGRGKIIGIKPCVKYPVVLAEADELRAAGKYEEAFKKYFDAAIINNVGLDARVGGTLCQLDMEMYKEAKVRLKRMQHFITTKEYAQKYYTLYARAEMGLQNYQTAAACAYMALSLGEDESASEILESLKELGVDLSEAQQNPLGITEKARIEPLTPEELKFRIRRYGLFKRGGMRN